jgi:RNA polymerase sigma-70 factor, ECF subfamily
MGKKPIEDGRRDAPGTLGALLYADNTKSRVSEAEWVALVQAIAAHDQLALRSLYERAHRLVFTLIVRIAGNRESAEEVTLDVFHDIWEGAARYDPADGTVLGWIMNQARCRALDRWRFDNRKKRTDAQPALRLAPTDETQSDDVVELREQGLQLRDALGTLTADERQAIETAYFSEVTYAEVAARLHQPLGTIKTRIRSGLAKLRNALSEVK